MQRNPFPGDFQESFFKFQKISYVTSHTITPEIIVILFTQGLPYVKGKVFPYSLPSVGPGADPGVQAVSPQVT